MAGPQRHRLLQGYPMAPLMRLAAPPEAERHGVSGVRDIDGTFKPEFNTDTPPEPPWIELDDSRPLIVGVLPHTQCSPKVEGCGFCTFPHDRYDKGLLRRTVSGVEAQIDSFFARHPTIGRRRVDGLYFGGATANLTPADDLRRLGGTLARHLDLRGAEVTLEGVPALFRSLFTGPFEVLCELPARHRRISMGVQTFDLDALRRMGRHGFGDRATVTKVVDKAHRHGVTVSGDFLVNLPGQALGKMLADVRDAVAIGLDQICIYHLVLTEHTTTPWAKDPAVLAALPPVATACDYWLAVRDSLLAAGYVQTTLTNFERREVHASERRFVYEEHSFTPERYDALGFGPLAISTFINREQRRALKLVRGKSLDEEYRRDLYFAYDAEDLRLLLLTRTLARLRVDRALFDTPPAPYLTEALAAVIDEGLAVIDDHELRLTPRGMFYADSIAGLFAAPRVEALRAGAAGLHTNDLHDEAVDNDFMG